MLEKIKNALDAKVEKELSEMKKRIEDLETYVLENENTEDEGVMIKILTSKNIIKRLNKEQPIIEERLQSRNSKAQSILQSYEWTDGKNEELAKVKKLTGVLENFKKDMLNGNLKSANDLMPGVRRTSYADMQGITSLSHNELDNLYKTMLNFNERLELEVSRTKSMLKEYLEEYPNLKKLLKV